MRVWVFLSVLLLITHNGLAQISSPHQQAVAAVTQMSLRQKVNEMRGRGRVRFALGMMSGMAVPVRAGGNEKQGIPSTVFLDGPRGVSLRKGTTAFPCTMARAASWDPDLEQEVGAAMAREIRALGGNYSGAMCMNLLRHPGWGRAQETYGEDPHHVGRMAEGLMLGLHRHRVQSCAKHFALNSMENNRFGGNFLVEERTLREVYLPHFERVVRAGATSVMSAYNRVNGEYCGENRHLLTDILRKEWGFTGYVTSDWEYGITDPVMAIKAGMNIEMPSGKRYSVPKIRRALKKGKISEADIDSLVVQSVRTKLEFLSRPDTAQYTNAMLASKAHTDLARKVAEQSAVLLRNEHGALPLQWWEMKSVVVTGSMMCYAETGDRGSSRCYPSYFITPLQGIEEALDRTPVRLSAMAHTQVDALRDSAAKADAVIVFAGTTYKDEGEYIGGGRIRSRENPDKGNFIVNVGSLGLGGDRTDLRLRADDVTAIQTATAVNRRVIVVLIGGSAFTVEEWHEGTGAILQTFYNGMEGGRATARILFGDVNPSGKLPFTVANKMEDYPPFDPFSPEVEYGYFHGYTLLDKNGVEPRYRFGHGLSYTSFRMDSLHFAGEVWEGGKQTAVFAVKLTNTGNRPGAEVVQAYVSFPGTKVQRPKELLRDFGKVPLRQGESAWVPIHIRMDELRYFDLKTNAWNVEEGQYRLVVRMGSDIEHAVDMGF
jgi:beta-glucosidase